MIWANLIHLGFSMWSDRPVAKWDNVKRPDLKWVCHSPELRFDQALWCDITQAMADVGMNMVILDLGEGVRYQSHREIAAKNAWTPAKLKSELSRLRKLGLEPIPKLNFSAGHDAWLGAYSRCVSTPIYYKVCSDLIAETMKLFEGPRFFHLGYDEETFGNQTEFDFACVRQHELWWHDFHTPRIHPTRLKGFMQTPWVPTVERFREKHMDAVARVAKVISSLDRDKK